MHAQSTKIDTDNVEVVNLSPCAFPQYGSQRVKVRYPTVVVPPMTQGDGMGGFFDPSTFLPCNDCHVTSMQMGLEYSDGTTADANTGLWLHHGVMVNRNQTDAVCGPEAYGQRFFASGNERTLIDISVNGYVRLIFSFRAKD